MSAYVERTDGSYVEEKSAGLIWHFLDADPEFGRWQARELHDHLENVLGAFNVEIVSGQGLIWARHKHFNKGEMVKRIITEAQREHDFVLCCGDDRTDEDMFSYLASALGSLQNLFTCTVGMKPSYAKFYLRAVDEVSHILSVLTISGKKRPGMAGGMGGGMGGMMAGRGTSMSAMKGSQSNLAALGGDD
mmetsp:Transcript_8600/g.21381  ORF Transcript_8600/g.21381 Transcript_8600/m.21381 type:complete len:190 (+) Transcript_8600:134-703(+)